jgi:hypothetical protein
MMRQIKRNPLPCYPATLKGAHMNTPLPASALLHSIEKLTNIVYLTKLDADDKIKVRNYMTEAEGELERLKEFAEKIAPPSSPQQVN